MLQDRPDVRLTAVTIEKYRHFYDDGTDVEIVDSVADLTQVRLAALRIRERNPFEYVVSPSEWSVQAGGYIRSYFGLPGTGYEVANAFSNKFVMKQKLAAAGLPVAAFRRLSRLEEAAETSTELGWPLVVKRACGGGSGYVVVVRDAEHLRALGMAESTEALRVAPFPLMAEEKVDIDAEFHCDGVVVDAKVRFAPVSRYFKPVLDSVGGVIGSATLSEAHPDAQAVAALHEQAVTTLGLQDGVTHLEVFKTGSGYLIGEIACRPGGGGIVAQIRHQYGVDLWDAFLAAQLGEPVAADCEPRTDHMIQYMLPRPVGTVTSVTRAEELLAAEGVIHAEVKTKIGDTLTGPLDSSIYAGFVLMRATDEAQITRRITYIDNLFHIHTSTNDSTQPTGNR
ncbi:ATP-grasp domain-containing protein [Streptomyces lunalinharesii]|uniref:ATP-grasp domain-containing protein n=1 Tax=Streptomyces lunalinharesii TaxID=333384 RepID=UPI0031CFEEE9